MFRTLGEAMSILLTSERKRYGIASIGAFVLPFAKLRHIKIFCGQNHLTESCAWANFSDVRRSLTSC